MLYTGFTSQSLPQEYCIVTQNNKLLFSALISPLCRTKSVTSMLKFTNDIEPPWKFTHRGKRLCVSAALPLTCWWLYGVKKEKENGLILPLCCTLLCLTHNSLIWEEIAAKSYNRPFFTKISTDFGARCWINSWQDVRLFLGKIIVGRVFFLLLLLLFLVLFCFVLFLWLFGRIFCPNMFACLIDQLLLQYPHVSQRVRVLA